MTNEASTAQQLGRTVPCLIRSLQCSGAVFLMLFMASFFSWGAYKITQPERYMQTESETLPWDDGAMELPEMGIHLLDTDSQQQTIEVRHCTIKSGNVSTKKCTQILQLSRCAIVKEIECLPRLKVEGTFGDSVYTYVSISSRLPKDAQNASFFSLRWKQREALSWTANFSQRYTSVKDMPMSSELFFQKVVAKQGEPFGLLGRTGGNDESGDLLNQETYMLKASEYTYPIISRENAKGGVIGRTLYIRATKTQHKDFHEVYSFMKLLEAVGGLYTLVSLIIFFPLVIISKLLRYSALICCHRANVCEPAEATEPASTEAPVHASEAEAQIAGIGLGNMHQRQIRAAI